MDEVSILGLLPVRSGSKGLPGKNVRPFLGKPLLTWSASALAASSTVTRKICCSDSEQMLDLARQSGLSTPWLRPDELAQDSSMVIDVVLNALASASAKYSEEYNYVVIVQATSPSVTADIIDEAVSLTIASQADTVITGYEANSNHPNLMFHAKSDGSVQWLSDTGRFEARRQEFDQVFVRTGVAYVAKVDSLLKNSSLYGDKIVALTIPEERAIAIDTEYDFRLAELAMKLYKD